jgi:hypothetical protein
MNFPFSDGDWVEFVDEQGRQVEMPYQQYVHLQKRKIAEADRALGIERSQIPAEFFNIPEHPDSAKFLQLASAIERIPYSVPVCFETQEAGVWMRCVQLYWNAKAIALAARLYPLPMPDPLAEGGFIQTHLLPSPAFRNLKLDVDADESWYCLLVAGEPYVRQWAEEHGHDYPFVTAEDLFIETLRIGFEISLTQDVLCPTPLNWTRKQHRDHYRRWLKFLGDHFNDTPVEAEFKAVLMTMSWKGYALAALRPLKVQKQFARLWKRYFKAHRPLVNFLDAAIDWEDDTPYTSAVSSSGRRTRQQTKIRSEVTEDGHLIWFRDKGVK